MRVRVFPSPLIKKKDFANHIKKGKFTSVSFPLEHPVRIEFTNEAPKCTLAVGYKIDRLKRNINTSQDKECIQQFKQHLGTSVHVIICNV